MLTKVPASGSANSSHLLEACIRKGVKSKDKAVTPALKHSVSAKKAPAE